MPARPPRPRRSCHVVPATSARMLEVGAGLDADELILDLEDSVTAGAKGAAARRALVGALLAPRRARTAAVRVNAVGSADCHRDLEAVLEGAGAAAEVIVVPKVEEPGELAFVDHLLAGLEAELGLEAGAIGIEAQVETARGLAAVEAIAAACPARLEALVLGPGDLAASLGMAATAIGAPLPGYPGDAWHHPLWRILVAARANGLQAIDGPYAAIRDPDGLRESAARSRALGYDGKWSIHPSQIEPLNAAYGLAEGELERARAVLAAIERAAERGQGAAELEGEMIDEATRRMAERTVERARLTGAEGPGADGPGAEGDRA